MTADANLLWYASTLVHEAAHVQLYRDYRQWHSTVVVPDAVWRGEAAERAALKAQYRTLKKLGAPESYLRHVRNVSSTRYWDQPTSW